MIRLDDPLDFFQSTGASDDILEQIRSQMPEAADPFSQAFEEMNPNAADDNNDAFSFRGFAANTLDFFSGLNLNPNNNLQGNLWNIATGGIEGVGVNLGPIGVLNPNDDLQGNIARVSNWTIRNVADILREDDNLPDMRAVVRDIFRNAFGKNSAPLVAEASAINATVPEGVGGLVGRATGLGGAGVGAARGAAVGAARGVIGGVVGIAVGAVIGAVLSEIAEGDDESETEL